MNVRLVTSPFCLAPGQKHEKERNLMNHTAKVSTGPADKQLFMWIVTVVFALLPCAVRADIVTEWNEKAFTAMEAEKVTGGFGPARILSIMHAAMFDAVNAVDKRY